MPVDELTAPQLWVNEERTVLVRSRADGTLEVALRSEPEAIWGPPIIVREEPAS